MKTYLFNSIGATLLLLFVIAPLSFAQTVVQETPFDDVPIGSRHYVAITYLKGQHIITGYGDNTFRPKQDINRAEALAILLKTLNKTNTSNIEPKTFPDVKPTDWFYTNIQNSYLNGIISGYPDGLFHPERTINRVECLKMILLQEDQPLPVTIDASPYSDVPTDSWFAPYAQISKERGLFLETRREGGELLADTSVNRGEFAEVIYHLLLSNKDSLFGRATFYSDSLEGNGTAAGEKYDPNAMTAASLTLPFNTRVLVKNLANGSEVTVRINDRGPYATGIVLDLSRKAFTLLALPSTGIINVEYKILPEEYKF